MKYKLHNPHLDITTEAWLSPYDNRYYSRSGGKGIKFGRTWELVKIPTFQDFHDQRGNVWEWFGDISYYDMICVRMKGDRNFDSLTSFHFNTIQEAADFVYLLSRSS